MLYSPFSNKMYFPNYALALYLALSWNTSDAKPKPSKAHRLFCYCSIVYVTLSILCYPHTEPCPPELLRRVLVTALPPAFFAGHHHVQGCPVFTSSFCRCNKKHWQQEEIGYYLVIIWLFLKEPNNEEQSRQSQFTHISNEGQDKRAAHRRAKGKNGCEEVERGREGGTKQRCRGDSE